MYQTLYRKWRPKTFDDVFGQEHITSILRYEITEQKTTHAYLFCGSRGIGKTTCAKILAKALNCEHPVNGSPCGECASCRGIESGAIIDVVEMDAASNNGVNDIRDIKENLDFVPAEVSRRVYIIDEVHMLSISAFNALLKTLEEPPEHAVFILATTELSKIPATILSRCQRFDFRRIDADVMVRRLRQIADAEQIRISDEALYLIARVANGGMRDAIGMLELCAGSASGTDMIDEPQAAVMIGVSDLETMAGLTEAITDRNYDAIFQTVDTVAKGALDFDAFWSNLMLFYRDLLVIKSTKDPTCFLEVPPSHLERMRSIAAKLSTAQMQYHMQILEETFSALQSNRISKRAACETGLFKMCDLRLDCSVEALLGRIESLESRLAGGSMTIPAAAKADQTPAVEKQPAAKSPAASFAEEGPAPSATLKYSKWQDVVRRCAASGGICAMLKKCRAVTDPEESYITVLAPDRITHLTVSSEQSKKLLIDALNAEAGSAKYHINNVDIRICDTADEEVRDLFAELMEEQGESL